MTLGLAAPLVFVRWIFFFGSQTWKLSRCRRLLERCESGQRGAQPIPSRKFVRARQGKDQAQFLTGLVCARFRFRGEWRGAVVRARRVPGASGGRACSAS